MFPRRRSILSRWFVSRGSFIFVKCLIHICLIFVWYLFDFCLIGILGFLNVLQEEICLEQVVCKQKKFHICHRGCARLRLLSLAAKRNCCQISLISQMQPHIQIQIPTQIHKHLCNSGDSLFIILAMNHDFLRSADQLIKTSLNLTVVCFEPLRNCMEWNGLHFLFVHAPSLNRKRSVPLQMGSITITAHNHNLIHNFQIQNFYLTRICVRVSRKTRFFLILLCPLN